MNPYTYCYMHLFNLVLAFNRNFILLFPICQIFLGVFMLDIKTNCKILSNSQWGGGMGDKCG